MHYIVYNILVPEKDQRSDCSLFAYPPYFHFQAFSALLFGPWGWPHWASHTGGVSSSGGGAGASARRLKGRRKQVMMFIPQVPALTRVIPEEILFLYPRS